MSSVALRISISLSKRYETLHTSYTSTKIPNSFTFANRNLTKRNRSHYGSELNRNTGKRGYRPKQAHHFSRDRKANNSQSITDFGWAYVQALLAKKFSPEQITGRLRYLGWQGIPSHERIYQYIYADKKAGGKLYKYLHCQKTYRK